MLVAVVEGGQVYYVRSDHIGRPVFATDSTGTKVWEASYRPFGGVQASSGASIDLRFPGQWFQSEAGLHQNWMRDYDPTLGRYLQADPLGLVDGASVYGYVRQNPGRYIDFSGTVSTAALKCFLRNYRDMKEVNVIGADKYFHCKANCCATREGSEQCATDLSQLREFTDDLRKGPNPLDRLQDEYANRQGREGGQNRRLQSCKTVCFSLRPIALPERY